MNEKHVEARLYRTDGIVEFWQEQVTELKESAFESTLNGNHHAATVSTAIAQYLSEQIEAAEDFLSQDD